MKKLTKMVERVNMMEVHIVEMVERIEKAEIGAMMEIEKMANGAKMTKGVEMCTPGGGLCCG